MELHSAYVITPVAHGHDVAFIALGSHFQTLWKRITVNHPAVITSHHDASRTPCKHRIRTKLCSLCRHTMINIIQVCQLCAEHLPYRLMPKTNPEHRLNALVTFYYIKQQAGFVWNARAGA